jgi:hypothetical protein
MDPLYLAAEILSFLKFTSTLDSGYRQVFLETQRPRYLGLILDLTRSTIHNFGKPRL